MKTLLLSFAGGLLALVLFFILLPLAIISIASSGKSDEQVHGAIVLQIDMRAEMPDQPPSDGLASLFGQESFTDILLKLDAATYDDNVKGVFIRASEMGYGSSRAEEMRQAIKRLQNSGKFVISHSQGFFVGGPSSYRAVSASDEIWMQNGSDFTVPGFSLETMFLKGLFDKLGVTAEIEAFHEYKNAPNVYKETDYTTAHREAMTRLAQSLWDITITDIAEDRATKLQDGLDVKAALESSPYSAEEAKEFGFIDSLGWPETAERHALQMGGDATLVDIANYTPPELNEDAPKFAIVNGEGPIMSGVSGGDLLNPNAETLIASDTVANQIYEAGKNEKIKAIVFRVDSPGGSATASDQIWNAIEYVQSEYKKPVVISMGSVAASGGYYVAMGADSIVANRSTITGSIGVFGGKFAIADGLRKIGVNPSRIDVGGPQAALFVSSERLTDEQRSKMIEGLQRVYDRFTSLAAEGRNMPVEDLRNLAKGRVWSGEDALEFGLVDHSGGLIDAINVAKQLADVAEDTRVHMVPMVPKTSPVEALGAMFGASAQQTRSLDVMASIFNDPRVRTTLLQIQAMQSDPNQMAMAPVVER